MFLCRYVLYQIVFFLCIFLNKFFLLFNLKTNIIFNFFNLKNFFVVNKFDSLNFKEHYSYYKFFLNNNFNKITVNLSSNSLNLVKNNNVINYLYLFSILKNNYLNLNYLNFLYFFFFNNCELLNLKNINYNKLIYNNNFISKNSFFISNNQRNIIISKLKNYNLNFKPLDTIKNLFQNDLKIKFFTSDISHLIELSKINILNILYLRKTKIFNKGRYSRNRQTYRTGVYWSLYINIIAVVALYYWFYRFNMNFGYLWWMLYTFMFSFFVPKIVKFKFYKLSNLFDSFTKDFVWISNNLFFIKNIICNIFNCLFNFTKNNFLYLIFLNNNYFLLKFFKVKFFIFENILYLLNVIINSNRNFFFKYEYSNINIYLIEISKNFTSWIFR